MKKFIIYLSIFFAPFLILIPLEVELRNNTFKAKAEYLDNNSMNINWLILGSSQNWRAINPEFLNKNTASLAIGGSSIDIDLFLARQKIQQIPNLERIFIEVSYHTLEERHGFSWGKNHLLWVHFGINHYNNTIPWNDNLLITSQPIFYLEKLFLNKNKNESGKFNKYGFINKEPDTSYASPSNRFRRLEFDSLKIKRTSKNYLQKLHNKENIENYISSVKELNEFIQLCIKLGIKVTLVSPPKYYLYNQAMIAGKLERRNQSLSNYLYNEAVQVLVYDTLYQYKVDFFINENHLSIKGAKIFTKRLEEDINSNRNHFP